MDLMVNIVCTNLKHWKIGGLVSFRKMDRNCGVPLIQFLGWWARELGLCQPNPANSCFSLDQLELSIEFWPVLVKFQLAYWADSFPMF